ncbi:ABC-F family ATP-binding cassette domain-containing protein [Pseudaminobacter soli (ex Li et al. 2025)]|uniref:ABC transporter n=1 Tax=Pseudaminobacter soli (ex Li et al. 2025) TaxID=1295366 RepID=A0A2P7S626_9HYPH|nr:ABC-F family ATP-binding cassette domain-containing protein [Mesorhizobium soli]PSJ57916.1 ABC transporter [Mesorhizobium soli]
MPASIALSNLRLSTPDGRALLSGIDLAFGPGRTGLIGRNGVGKSTLVALIAGTLAPSSGSISVSGRLGIFKQSVQVGPEETITDLFGVSDALALLQRAYEGNATLEELADVDWQLEARMEAALAKIGLDVGPQTPLHKLSGGQRTRAGLAALHFSEADFLLMDEPTNNLDRGGRLTLYDMLANWRRGALVVSHDRELLELMDEIVELTSLGATRYGGNWSVYRERKALELASVQHDLDHAEKQASEVARATQVAQERKARRDGNGRRQALKGGAPRIVLGGLKSRSENSGGAQVRLASDRQSQALEAVATARGRIEVLQPMAVTLPPTGLSPSKTVLMLDSVSAGYAPDRPVFTNLSLSVTGPERVAVTGPNGSGKTTLLELIAGRLRPFSGSVQVTTEFAMLDQRVSMLDPLASIRDNFRRINPLDDENACRAALARFKFRADAALQMVSELSGGELLRAGMGCALGGTAPPPLLVLDEPTNHLDLEAIEAIEAGLRAYDGALIVVSHDEAFLTALDISRRIELPSGEGRFFR